MNIFIIISYAYLFIGVIVGIDILFRTHFLQVWKKCGTRNINMDRGLLMLAFQSLWWYTKVATASILVCLILIPVSAFIWPFYFSPALVTGQKESFRKGYSIVIDWMTF